MKTRPQIDILDMLKALADESRLALLRLLNEQETTVSELALQLGLGEPTVSHHLARLREAGLVTLRMEGSWRFYRINTAGLARFKMLAAEIEQQPARAEEALPDSSEIDLPGWDPADLQILREYTLGGQLTHLPTKRKKFLIVLRWLAMMFEPDRLYTEAEINAVLKSVYAEDFVSLRRDLIDFGFLRRERGGGKYWLAPEDGA